MEFYVYTSRNIEKNLTLDKAIELFNSNKTGEYIAIGIEEGEKAIDIFCKKEGKKWTSKDIKYTSKETQTKILEEVDKQLKRIEVQ